MSAEDDPSKRIVVTGMGCVTSLGLDVEITWQNLTAGHSGIRNIRGDILKDYPQLPEYVGAPIDNFDFWSNPDMNVVEKKELRYIHRSAQFALWAGAQAARQAGLVVNEVGVNAFLDERIISPGRIGVSIGTGIGGAEELGQVTKRLDAGGLSKSISPIFYVLPERVATVPSMAFGCEGPVQEVTGACATGNLNLIQAAIQLKSGLADVVLAGGTEAQLTPENFDLFNVLGALDKTKYASLASRPFHMDANGFVVGEGAGVLALETLKHANDRGAEVLAELLGFANNADAKDKTFPSGAGAVKALELALSMGGVKPGQPTYINAHATGTSGDAVELSSVSKVFDKRDVVAISSTKGATTHLLGCSSALEAIFSIQALRTGVIPPTLKLDKPIPETNGWYMSPHESTEVKFIKYVINNAFGFGGINAVTIFGHV